MRTLELRGMRAFSLVWAGQVLSLLGSGMTRFALLIWIWQQTGQAFAVVLVWVFTAAPELLATFFAGALVDRWSRKTAIIVGDLGAGLATVALLVLLLNDQLAVWHLYVAGGVAGVAGAFHSLAFTAAITTLIPSAQYSRAAGMQTLAEYASLVGAPLLAGALIGFIDLEGIMMIDIATFLIAVLMIAVIHIPHPDAAPESETGAPGLLREALFGFKYIFARKGLLGLTMMALAFNTLEGMSYLLIPPMILARTGENEFILGFVQAISGVGGVVGGLAMSVWGGPRRKFRLIVIAALLTGLLGDVMLGIGRGVAAWALAAFFLECFIPAMIASHQSIWQMKVAPALQGRVFGARRLMSMALSLPAVMIAGALADRVFEPAMAPGGALADSFGWLVGVGPGAGMALLMVIFGLLSGLSGLAGYAFNEVRNVETLLPDYRASAESPEITA